jgi:lipoprotein LprG
MPQISRTYRKLAVIACIAAVAVTLSACNGKKKDATPAATGPLPAAADLMTQAATAMSSVNTVHFTLKVDGSLPNLPISAATGDLTKEGNAQGTATAQLLGSNVETKFIIIGQDAYLNVTGSYQKTSLASITAIFDPSSILDPDRGIAKLLATGKDPKTLASESVNGKATYKVSFTPDPTVVGALVPGAPADTACVVWLDATSHQVVRGQFTVPAAENGGKAATVTIDFSNYDAPVTISAP